MDKNKTNSSKVVGTDARGWSVRVGDVVPRVTDGASFRLDGVSEDGIAFASRKTKTQQFGVMCLRGDVEKIRVPACAMGIMS